MSDRSLQLGQARWRRGVAAMVIVLAVVYSFCLVHCSDDHGGMSPEQCAKTMVAVALAGLAVTVTTALLVPGLVPVAPRPTIRLLDRPPKPLRP